MSRQKMRGHVAEDLRERAQLDNPAFYADPHPVLARLRAEAPVYWYEPGQFWAVTRHADVTTVSTQHRVYSVARQGTRLADRSGSRRPVPGARPVFTTDPPEHTYFRRVLRGAFTPRGLSGLEESIRAITRELLDAFDKDPGDDFVHSVAAPLPIFVIAQLLGLSRSDWEQLKQWTDVRVALLDASPDSARHQDLEKLLAEYFSYLGEILAQRSRSPSDDVVSLIASEAGMSDPDRVQMLNSLVIAGNETTRSALSCAAVSLAQHPKQWMALKADPSALAQGATEEVLRWATPIIHFARTAMSDTVLGGEAIAAGDFVVMIYPSANRDEAVWDRADRFELARSANPHLAFGTGIHTCLGAALARMEIRVALEELASRYDSWRLSGDVERVSSVHVNQYRRVPVLAGRTQAPGTPE